jgi:hypothetical protein
VKGEVHLLKCVTVCLFGEKKRNAPMNLPVCLCVHYCSTDYKAVRVGIVEDMCYERRRAEAWDP